MTAATVNVAQPSAAAAPDAEAVVRCLNLTKLFRDFWLRPKARAVDAINLDVRRGEVFGLLGPNGSGKSTTIKLVLGLLHPTQGRVLVFGKRPDDVSTKKRIGYLPEESYLYRFLNASETLDYYARLFHLNLQQRRQRVGRLLEMVGLEAVARRPVGEYSKGMQRRIGLAQALINDPDLLILDEPTTGMDPIGTRQIKDLIINLARRGKTIILCSHLLADVEDVCDRVAIMFGGKIRALGTVDELLSRQDATLLQTDPLDGPTLQEVTRVLEAHGRRLLKRDQPRQKLEALFLDIVTQAQAEGAETSGARAGGEIADFLAAPAAAAATPQEVLEHLVQPPPPAPPGPPATSDSPAPALTSPEPAPAPAPPQPSAAPSAEGPDHGVLDGLLAESWRGAAEPQTPAAPPPTPAAPAGATPAAPTEGGPTAAELAVMRQLGSSWTGRSDPPPAPPPAAAPPAEPPKPAGAGGPETPDRSFLDALTDVTPYEEDQPKKDTA